MNIADDNNSAIITPLMFISSSTTKTTTATSYPHHNHTTTTTELPNREINVAIVTVGLILSVCFVIMTIICLFWIDSFNRSTTIPSSSLKLANKQQQRSSPTSSSHNSQFSK
ncbi:hypothetical protein DERF_006488 [Dermatophagoides farinae]|uniref:Uncharacterized protein n=1 Tax=Dermatophagoides farinae TaxID=6954 RepID=A0A922I7L6_DERFA|nr:hypothetical protein HUG17_2807 [Dermatophagoides farinae]KAH9522935.1 hypothetical protein DERF_006488 [Dermatophagoides farinae]